MIADRQPAASWQARSGDPSTSPDFRPAWRPRRPTAKGSEIRGRSCAMGVLRHGVAPIAAILAWRNAASPWLATERPGWTREPSERPTQQRGPQRATAAAAGDRMAGDLLGLDLLGLHRIDQDGSGRAPGSESRSISRATVGAGRRWAGSADPRGRRAGFFRAPPLRQKISIGTPFRCEGPREHTAVIFSPPRTIFRPSRFLFLATHSHFFTERFSMSEPTPQPAPDEQPAQPAMVPRDVQEFRVGPLLIRAWADGKSYGVELRRGKRRPRLVLKVCEILGGPFLWIANRRGREILAVSILKNGHATVCQMDPGNGIPSVVHPAPAPRPIAERLSAGTEN